MGLRYNLLKKQVSSEHYMDSTTDTEVERALRLVDPLCEYRKEDGPVNEQADRALGAMGAAACPDRAVPPAAWLRAAGAGPRWALEMPPAP